MIAADQEQSFDRGSSDIGLAAKGAGISFIGKTLGNIIQYLYAVFIARILGVESYGVYMLGFTIITLVAMLGRMGMDNAAIKYVAQFQGGGERGKLSHVIRDSLLFSFIVSVLVAVILFVLAGYLANTLFDMPRLGGVLEVLAVSIPPFTVMIMALAVTQGFKVMRYTAYCQNLLFPIANILLVFGFYLAGGGLQGVAIPYVLSSFLSAVLALYYLRIVFPDFSLKGGGIDAGELVAVRRDLFGFSSPLFIIVLLTTLFCWSDTLMLGYFRTSHEVGVYSAAVRTAMLMTVILLSFNLITSPMVAELHSKNESGRLESLFKFTSRWIYTISMLLFLEMLLFSSEIMSFFGVGFAEGWYVLAIVGFTYFMNSATGSVGVVLVMSGHQKLVMYDAIGVFIFNIAANYILIPLYGMTGAAAASAASIIGYNLLILAQVYWKLKIHPYNRKFIEPTLSGAVVFVAVYFAMQGVSLQGLEKIAVFGPISALFFMLLIFAACFHEEDKVLIAQLGDRRKYRVKG